MAGGKCGGKDNSCRRRKPPNNNSGSHPHSTLLQYLPSSLSPFFPAYIQYPSSSSSPPAASSEHCCLRPTSLVFLVAVDLSCTHPRLLLLTTMRSQTFVAAIVATWAAAPASAQSYSNCNPLTSSKRLWLRTGLGLLLTPHSQLSSGHRTWQISDHRLHLWAIQLVHAAGQPNLRFKRSLIHSSKSWGFSTHCIKMVHHVRPRRVRCQSGSRSRNCEQRNPTVRRPR